MAAYLAVLVIWCFGSGWTVADTAAPPIFHSPPVEMQPGRAYPAGTRVRIPKGAASFVVPAGWHAQLPEDSDAIIAVSESGAGFVMIFMILNLTEEELTAVLSQPQPLTHDLIFEPAGPVTKRGGQLTAAYQAGSLSGRALTLMGPNQQGVLFFLGRPPSQSPDADRVLDDLAASTQFATGQ